MTLHNCFDCAAIVADSAIELYEICLPHTYIVCSFALFFYPFLTLDSHCITLLTKGKIYDKLLNDFTLQSGQRDVTISDSQIRHLAVAFVERMKKCHIQTKIIASDTNSTKVEVTVEHVNFDSLGNDSVFQNELRRRVQNVNDMEQRQSIVIDALIEYIPEMPTEGTRSFTVECEYDQGKREWVIKYPDSVMSIFITTVMQGW